jgi:uroporphyrin-III C-methyltransferase
MDARTPGRVTLVGAGPGDPELLTLKAVRALEQADIVLVDDLVSPEVLVHAPRARVVYVGKRAGRPSTPQDRINGLLVRLARRGWRIVRLKGGDPMVFGRGGEELLALRRAGIEADVVPGITSGIAVPATLGVPVTHRGLVTGVALITGQCRDEREPDWQALVRSGLTLVVYMGLARLPRIVASLQQAGLAASHPALAIQDGTRATQRQVAAPLSALAGAVEAAGFAGPCLIVIGEVTRLAATDLSTLCIGDAA